MKYPEEIRTENGVEAALMVSLSECNFDRTFMKVLEKQLNQIGKREDMVQAEKIALTGYIFIETINAVMEDDAEKVRPELLLKALEEASRFDKVIKKEDVE